MSVGDLHGFLTDMKFRTTTLQKFPVSATACLRSGMTTCSATLLQCRTRRTFRSTLLFMEASSSRISQSMIKANASLPGQDLEILAVTIREPQLPAKAARAAEIS